MRKITWHKHYRYRTLNNVKNPFNGKTLIITFELYDGNKICGSFHKSYKLVSLCYFVIGAYLKNAIVATDYVQRNQQP